MGELLGAMQRSLDARLTRPASEHAGASALPSPVTVASLTWRLTPTYSITLERTNMVSILLRQRFDFAAAHRLHVPSLSDEQNRAIFGRCNNPAGHGHNYGVQPTVRVALSDDPMAAPAFDLAALERVTDATLIQPFDHTHLNEDTAEFATGLGLNPSVEHIARVFYERLKPAIAAASAGQAELVDITVWETERTSACYAGT
jgi:6-pyruvoyltetrahydropterin/6-carboxytetrahydropterin synthase